ncbi:MAG: hypothetical protein HDT33_04335 [Clostridiales bacterium]|nr:hypothetical protein [Clostridiales bacterium]
MKRLAALIAAAIMILSMASCSSKCKWDGCDDKAVKNGYCEVHNALHELEKLFG